MAIGTGAAILGSAVLGAGASLLGGKSQGKAIDQAAAQNAAATQAQLQLGRESMALNKDIYNSNYNLLSPFVSRGNVAGQSINALLGLPSAPAMASPMAPPAGQSSWSAAANAPPSYSQIAAMRNDGIDGNWNQAINQYAASNPGLPPGYTGPTLTQIMAMKNDGIPGNFEAAYAAYNAAMAAAPPPAAPTPAPATGGTGTPAPATGTPATPAQPNVTPISANQAFENFANSAGMQFQLKTAQDAINNGYAGAGALQSGAAMKAISDRSQDVALNNYFLPYMGLLGGQQAVGAQSGAAVAGVGSNFGNTAANINAGMGNTIANGASNAGNLALAQGQSNANMWGQLGSSFGTALGALGSMGGGGSNGGYNVNAYGGWS